MVAVAVAAHLLLKKQQYKQSNCIKVIKSTRKDLINLEIIGQGKVN